MYQTDNLITQTMGATEYTIKCKIEEATVLDQVCAQTYNLMKGIK